MDNIYCEECENYGGCDQCFSPENKKIESWDNYRSKGQAESEIWRPEEQNKNNNCKYFKLKRKWWKRLWLLIIK